MDGQASTLRRRHGGSLFMVLVAVGCGVAGAFGAVVFRFLIRSFQGLFFEGLDGLEAVVEEGLLAEPHDPLAIARALPWQLCLLIPALGGLIVGPLVHFFAREARGHGVPEVMESVALRGGVMRARVVAVKTLASALSIGSGGSVGREGPIVQIGSAIGSVIGQLLRVPARQLRTIVGCGAAAGISATFNAPIAGALFAVEVIVGDFAVAQFSPIVISSVVATVISRFLLGNHPAFPVPEYELVSPVELGAYVAVGVLAALVGVLFILSLHVAEDAFDRLRIPEWSKAAVGGLGVGAIAIVFPNVFGVGYGTISQALAGSLTAGTLALLLVAKIVATSVTIGSGGSGGVFAPSLFLGAVTGGCFGTLIHQAFPEATASSGAYALVTMGAVVAATTQAPITAIIILFELTQSITIIPPLMAACVVSTLLAGFLYRDSIYTAKLRRRGVDLERNDDPNVLKCLYVRDIVDRDPEVIRASARLDGILDLIVESEHTEYFVVNRRDELIGAISLSELRRVLREQDHLRSIVVAEDLVGRPYPTVTESNDLHTAMQIFSQEEVEEIAVVEAGDPHKLVGSLHKRDLIHAYNAEVMRRDLAGGLSSTVAVVDRVQEVRLGGDYVVRQVTAPSSFAGRSLAELNLRARTGVQILLIRSTRARGEAMRVPTPEDRLEPGDALIAAGSAEALDRLEKL